MKTDLGYEDPISPQAGLTSIDINVKEDDDSEDEKSVRYPCLYVRLPKTSDLLAKLGSSGKATIEYEVVGMSKNKGMGESIELDIKSIDPIGKSSVDASKDSDEALEDFMRENKLKKK